jgi:hypothetical protein
MFKLFLVLIVAIAAALYFPRSRAVVIRYGAPVLNPAFRMATKSEMGKISRDVQVFERETGRLPDTNNFPRWLEGRYAGDAGQDSWGNTYVLVVRERSFDILSLGPDGSRGTPDDIVETRNRR